MDFSQRRQKFPAIFRESIEVKGILRLRIASPFAKQFLAQDDRLKKRLRR
jgi:hypothetical protein